MYIISKDKNKIFVGEGIENYYEKEMDYRMVKKGNDLKSIKGSGLKILE